MRVTITNIAEVAGVSRGTVDKVIHNRAGVSDAVRAHVQHVIEELDYHPNRIARALKQNEKRLCFVVFLPDLENPFFSNIKRGMDEALARLSDYNIEIQYYYFDEAKQLDALIEQLHALDISQISGLALRGVDNPVVIEKLNAFSSLGLPIVLFDSDIRSVSRLCFIGENHLHSGRMAASLLGKCMGRKGQVAVITGSFEFEGHRLRMQGFEDVVKERFPHIEIVTCVEAQDQGAIAYRETCRILDEYPELKGIFVSAGRAVDVAKAMIEKNRSGQTHIVSYNATADIISLLDLGIVDFTLRLLPSRQGSLVIDTLFHYVFNHEVPPDRIETPVMIGFDENYASHD